MTRADRKKATSERTRIVIAEDDYLVATQMEDALMQAGFQPAAVVASAEEAVKAAVDNRVALVVMDIRLAGKRDGVDAAIELFQKHGMRCIFATAHVDAAVRQRAEAAQPLGWLQKPYSMTSLIELVREALGRLDDELGRIRRGPVTGGSRGFLSGRRCSAGSCCRCRGRRR